MTVFDSGEVMSAPEMTEATLKLLDGVSVEAYNPEENRYHNPLKNARDGKHYNWDSASSGFIPRNTVQAIKHTHATVPQGLAEVVAVAADRFEAQADCGAMTQREVFGLVEELVIRFGRGAQAEVLAELELEKAGKTVLPSEEGDENRGIDLRTGDVLYQVKFNDETRSDWEEPTPNPNAEGDTDRDTRVIWVNHDSKVQENTKQEEYRVEDRFVPV